MCGILGRFNFRSKEPVSALGLENLLGEIHHRGPDGSGVVVDGPLGLGMTRLAIIGLSDGQQPMRTPDERYSIVFNGEIYNYQELRRELAAGGYRFRTGSDTEVILALKSLGIDSELKLRGMFAYALYDHKLEKLELCRDRLGKKPLFWSETPGGIVFGSEIKTLLASGLVETDPDLNAISDFLTLSYIPGNQTAFKHISQVPPGHKLIVDDDVRVERYWQLPTIAEADKEQKSDQEWLEEIREKLLESVKYRLVSDVPVGVFLSGGIDSALVLSMVMQSSPTFPVKTYTVGFDSPSYDESETARSVADYYGVSNTVEKLTPSYVASHFDHVVHNADNLLANPAMFANHLLSSIAGKEIKVALNGGGGDELFFGYPTYQATALASLGRFAPSSLSRLPASISRFIPTSHQKLSASYKARKFLEGFTMPRDQAHYWWRTIITEEEKRTLLNGRTPARDSYWAYESAYNEYSGDDWLEKYSYADLAVWWRSMGLYQSDSMSMANSLELRVPMMDHEFVELAYRIPRKQKHGYATTKPLLRQLGQDVLPPELLKLKKAGFHVPLAEWYCGELRGFVQERLSADRVASLGFLEARGVDKIIQDHLLGKADNSYKITNLLVLVEWHHQFIQEARYEVSCPH